MTCPRSLQAASSLAGFKSTDLSVADIEEHRPALIMSLPVLYHNFFLQFMQTQIVNTPTIKYTLLCLITMSFCYFQFGIHFNSCRMSVTYVLIPLPARTLSLVQRGGNMVLNI
jgi:hypothetical protein